MQYRVDLNERLGKAGEDVAALYLQHNDYRILERNWKHYWGRRWWEIDIIAKTREKRHWFSRQRKIVFVEVKTLKQRGFLSSHPEQRVNRERQQRLERAATLFLERNDIPINSDWQIDVIAVLVDPITGAATIRHTPRAIGSFT